MGTLTPDEIDIINFRLARRVSCPARGYAVKLRGATVTPEDLLEMQLFANQTSQPCLEVWMFKRLYDDYRIRKRDNARRRDDPTTQEVDRKRWQKTCAIITAWCHAAAKMPGRLKKIALLR